MRERVSVLINSNNNAALLAGAVTFIVSTPATSIAGAAVPVTVTAVDANGNPVTGFLGTIGISSNDPQGGNAVTSYTFTAADAGTHTFTAGRQAVHRRPRDGDVTAALMTSASQSVLVTPAAATHFAVAAPASAAARARPPPSRVTALDAYGNTATGYTGTVRFTSTDGQATLPAPTTFTTADAGVKTVSVVLKSVAAQRAAGHRHRHGRPDDHRHLGIRPGHSGRGQLAQPVRGRGLHRLAARDHRHRPRPLRQRRHQL